MRISKNLIIFNVIGITSIIILAILNEIRASFLEGFIFGLVFFIDILEIGSWIESRTSMVKPEDKLKFRKDKTLKTLFLSMIVCLISCIIIAIYGIVTKQTTNIFLSNLEFLFLGFVVIAFISFLIHNRDIIKHNLGYDENKTE